MPNRKTLASAGHDKTVRVWDLTGGIQRKSLSTKAAAWSVAFSPDGRLLAAGGQKTIRMWDTGKFRQTKALEGHNDFVTANLAIELGPLGHRVNLLKFGTVMTPALNHVYTPSALARLEAAHRQMNTTGTMCTVEEVAQLVCLLLGPAAGWFSGATIDFTGGMNLKLIDVVLNPERHAS